MGKSTYIKFYAIRKLDYCWSYFVFGWQCSQVFNIVYACFSADVQYRNIYEDSIFVFSPNSRNFWQREQLHLFTTARESGETLRLDGDGRCCSLGHTAKYLSYTLMDLKTNKILDTQLVQVHVFVCLIFLFHKFNHEIFDATLWSKCVLLMQYIL